MTSKDAKRLLDCFQDIQQFMDKMPTLPQGLTPASLKLMGQIEELSRTSKEVRISDLADHLQQALPGITRSLKSLEAHGFIEKKQNPDDKRVFYIALTEQGQAVYQDYIHNYHGQIQKQLDLLPQKDLDQALDTMANILKLLKGETHDTNK